MHLFLKGNGSYYEIHCARLNLYDITAGRKLSRGSIVKLLEAVLEACKLLECVLLPFTLYYMPFGYHIVANTVNNMYMPKCFY